MSQPNSIDVHRQNKQLVGKYRAALYDCDVLALPGQLREVFAPACQIRLAFPFEELEGPGALFAQAYAPLLEAVPDLERRDFIVIAGESNDNQWVGCAGHYMGVFEKPWLNIPPTRHAMAMRYHEFFRVVGDRVVEKNLPRCRGAGGGNAGAVGHPAGDDAGRRLAPGAQPGG